MRIITIPIIENASGMLLGTDYIFKTIRGKTYLSRRPKPSTKPETVSQRETRSKFKDGIAIARAALLDGDRKAYYTRMANKLKLPNTYTAALTDYMRKPIIKAKVDSSTDTVSIEILKKEFDIVNAEINVRDSKITINDATRKIGKRIHVIIDRNHITEPLKLTIEDGLGQILDYDLGVI